MSLWTPSGEHPVDRPSSTPGTTGPSSPTAPPGGGAGPGGPGAPGSEAPGGGAGAGGGTPVDAERVEELRRQLADAPPEVVVANHCYGLFELGAIYLSQSPPLLPQAQLAIDALGLIVEGLGDRLGEAAPSLQDALAQLRMAWVQVDAAAKAQQQGGVGNGSDAGPVGG